MDYDDADVILVGVSRAGKTPTCLYLALHYGVRAANYPLTEEDLEAATACRRGCGRTARKLFGLTIDPVRLQQIRQERRPNSRYAQAGTRASAKWRRPRRMFRSERIADAEHDAHLDRGNRQQGADDAGHPPRDVLIGVKPPCRSRAGSKRVAARKHHVRPVEACRQCCRGADSRVGSAHEQTSLPVPRASPG